MHSYMVRYNQPRVEEALTQLKAGSAQTGAGAGRGRGMLRDAWSQGSLISQTGVGQLEGGGLGGLPWTPSSRRRVPGMFSEIQ